MNERPEGKKGKVPIISWRRGKINSRRKAKIGRSLTNPEEDQRHLWGGGRHPTTGRSGHITRMGKRANVRKG